MIKHSRLFCFLFFGSVPSSSALFIFFCSVPLLRQVNSSAVLKASLQSALATTLGVYKTAVR
jgi:hypothetical protein